jgi:hypothetical protein
MYNKNPLSSPLFENVAYECYIFHLINDTKMVAPYGLNLYIYY